MVLTPQHSGIPLHLSQNHRMRFCLYIQDLIQMIAVQGKLSLLLKCSPYRPALPAFHSNGFGNLCQALSM